MVIHLLVTAFFTRHQENLQQSYITSTFQKVDLTQVKSFEAQGGLNVEHRVQRRLNLLPKAVQLGTVSENMEVIGCHRATSSPTR